MSSMKRRYTFSETSFTDKFQPYDGTGIRICENESVSYIYICGIKPTRKIFINNNITLMPVSASANPDDMIGSFMKYGNGNEFQMGIYSMKIHPHINVAHSLVDKIDIALFSFYIF